jgi:hypothetical protein
LTGTLAIVIEVQARSTSSEVLLSSSSVIILLNQSMLEPGVSGYDTISFGK